VQARQSVDFCGSNPKRHQSTQTRFAQVHAKPGENAKGNREARIENGLVGQDIGADGAAQIRGNQDRAEDRRLRNHIEDRGDEQREADPENRAGADPHSSAGLDDLRQLEDFRDAIEKHEQHDETADDTSGPERAFGSGSR